MSKLTDEQMHKAFLSIAEEAAHTSFEEFMEEGDSEYIRKYARAIESAATEPLLQRIAELERQLEDARKDAEPVRRWKQRADELIAAFKNAPDGKALDMQKGQS